MGILIRESRWPGLPQERVPLNPLVPRPSLLFQGFSIWDPIAGTNPHSIGAFSAPGPGGSGLRLPANTDLGLTDAPDRFLSATAGSALVVLSREGGAQGSNAFAVSTHADAAARFSAHLPWSDGNIYWDFGGTGGANRLAVASGIVPQRVHAFVLTAGPLGSRIFCDGLLLASGGVATRSNAGARRFGIGVHFSPDLGWMPDTGATYYLACFWDRQLDDVLARALSADPTLIYEPQQIWLRRPAAAVGPTLRTLSATATGVAALGLRVQYARTLAASAVGTPDLGRRLSLLRDLTATAVAVPLLARSATYRRVLGAVATGVVVLLRQVLGLAVPRIVRVEWSLSQRSVEWSLSQRRVEWRSEGGGT